MPLKESQHSIIGNNSIVIADLKNNFDDWEIPEFQENKRSIGKINTKLLT